ncbi:Gfo/Idh/MocA family oxidoreductase [Qipengyuania sp. DY56-A-20]|uniref:Gfo/Idh/MocA family oxidoreductase n=1 Tax=Qipengyuania benthica TaxID=3067651 RepID=A0ABT9H5D8_9SPHN|nr:Gfo/Idh/MocA family oxidoreductase [Qipengyuania sp. DY56-A-20]MDP4538533.1 Gfo/Idh/MocA family oxidoreductase [Qipengyuania sp. DY56-A-20]
MSLPRVGFLGTGWIGRHRMEAIVAEGVVSAAALCDPSPDCVETALEVAPSAQVTGSLDEMLDCELDGLVIATPSALHASQAIAALERGIAVFCQKPLGRNEAEARAVIEAAQKADRLLGVDLSYRHTAATRAIAELIGKGGLGEVFAADLTFHNAYGPDKPWFYRREEAGGGCVMDLGVHLVDLALWLLDFPAVEGVSSRLYSQGDRLDAGTTKVEDYAIAQLDLAGGAIVRLACSWNLNAGREAAIEASFYGSQAAAGFRNVGGSFYDFEAFVNRGTEQEPLSAPPDEWGGRAACGWARRLAKDRGFDPEAHRLAEVSAVLDKIYSCA